MTYQARVTDGGEIVVPAALARELGLMPGDAISMDRDGSIIIVETYADTVRKGQQAFRAMITRPFTVDDFLADRRVEATRD